MHSYSYTCRLTYDTSHSLPATFSAYTGTLGRFLVGSIYPAVMAHLVGGSPTIALIGTELVVWERLIQFSRYKVPTSYIARSLISKRTFQTIRGISHLRTINVCDFGTFFGSPPLSTNYRTLDVVQYMCR